MSRLLWRKASLLKNDFFSLIFMKISFSQFSQNLIIFMINLFYESGLFLISCRLIPVSDFTNDGKCFNVTVRNWIFVRNWINLPTAILAKYLNACKDIDDDSDILAVVCTMLAAKYESSYFLDAKKIYFFAASKLSYKEFIKTFKKKEFEVLRMNDFNIPRPTAFDAFELLIINNCDYVPGVAHFE
jgi:hypothetical protein